MKHEYKNWIKKIYYDSMGEMVYVNDIPFRMKKDEFKRFIKGKEMLYEEDKED